MADGSPEAGVRLLDRVLETTDALSTLSERGRSVGELRGGSIREVLVHPYRIIYRVKASAVEILAIVHQRREDSFQQLDWLRERQASYAFAS